MNLTLPPHKKKQFQWPEPVEFRALLIILWRYGIKYPVRWQFWRQLFSILRHIPRFAGLYLGVCAQLEHFLEYRQIVRHGIERQLSERLQAEADAQKELTAAEVSAA